VRVGEVSVGSGVAERAVSGGGVAGLAGIMAGVAD